MASLPRPAPSLTRLSPPLGSHFTGTSATCPDGLPRLTVPPCAFNVSGALPATLMLIAETTSRGEHLLPTMPTWLRLASVGVAGLEPAASRSQSGRSTKLSHTPFLLLFLYCISCRCACQKMLPCGSSPTLTSTANVGSPMPGVHFSRRKLRPFSSDSLADMNNHSAQTNAMSTRKQVNQATMRMGRETAAPPNTGARHPARKDAPSSAHTHLTEGAIGGRAPTQTRTHHATNSYT